MVPAQRGKSRVLALWSKKLLLSVPASEDMAGFLYQLQPAMENIPDINNTRGYIKWMIEYSQFCSRSFSSHEYIFLPS